MNLYQKIIEILLCVCYKAIKFFSINYFKMGKSYTEMVKNFCRYNVNCYLAHILATSN